MEMKNAVSGLSALANAGRLSIFRMLVQAGREGVAAGEIARRLDVLPNTLSANLNILANAGLIDRKSTRLNSSHSGESRMPSSA